MIWIPLLPLPVIFPRKVPLTEPVEWTGVPCCVVRRSPIWLHRPWVSEQTLLFPSSLTATSLYKNTIILWILEGSVWEPIQSVQVGFLFNVSEGRLSINSIKKCIYVMWRGLRDLFNVGWVGKQSSKSTFSEALANAIVGYAHMSHNWKLVKTTYVVFQVGGLIGIKPTKKMPSQ